MAWGRERRGDSVERADDGREHGGYDGRAQSSQVRHRRDGEATTKPHTTTPHGEKTPPDAKKTQKNATQVLDIHGRQKQQKRTATFFEFCRATSGVLLCTDVAARGLDIPEVNWIVQFDPPV